MAYRIANKQNSLVKCDRFSFTDTDSPPAENIETFGRPICIFIRWLKSITIDWCRIQIKKCDRGYWIERNFSYIYYV